MYAGFHPFVVKRRYNANVWLAWRKIDVVSIIKYDYEDCLIWQEGGCNLDVPTLYSSKITLGLFKAIRRLISLDCELFMEDWVGFFINRLKTSSLIVRVVENVCRAV